MLLPCVINSYMSNCMPNRINVVHSIASLALRDGGPSYTVCSLASAQQSLTAGSVHIVAGKLEPGRDAKASGAVQVQGINRAWPGGLFNTRRVLKELLMYGDAVLHDHGIWHPQNLAASGFAARNRLPYVISIHGTLAAWALRYHPLRKKLARWLYQDELLAKARCLIATSVAEFESIRAVGLRNPVAIIPNGIDADIPVLKRQKHSSRRTVLFLSRIHPVKGLKHAIDAWNILRPGDWQLLIVGPSENGHREELEKQVAHYGLQEAIQFRDAVAGTEKYQCYYDADVFLLPSYSENFGVVIAEALACGLPVITTTGTPWSGLLDRRCGWYVDTGTDPLVSALREAFATAPEELQRMGEVGRQWMSSEFQWPAIAAQNLAVYEWILGHRDQPSCVDAPSRPYHACIAVPQTDQ
jgi:glycosyltransferase involved in cell wall biosynthesis